MTQPLLLYGMGSPNVRKVVIMLEELELPYELRHVAVFKGEQFTPEFLTLNPLGKVPVLVDPALGKPLAESAAILFYLAERKGRLLPAQPPARYEVMQWLMVQMASIGPMFGQLNHFQILPADTEAYARARYHEQAERLYRLLNERLTAREWIAGGAYSIADIAIYPWALYLDRHGFAADAFPVLRRWCDKLGARPAVQRADRRMDEAFTIVSNQTRTTASAHDLDLFFARTEAMPAADYSAVTR
jgi:GSH-dependent disulfide-bond oxidoreductase